MRDLLVAAGALADDYAAADWEASPVGPPSGWSDAMRGALEVVLHSKYPAALLWGPEFVQVYNEAYVELIGDKHPRALGRPTQESFGEIWEQVSPLMEGVLAGEGAVFVERALVPLRRHGFDEECWFTFCYSPVHGPDGEVEGIVNIATETTREVLAERRMRLLARLNEVAAEAGTVGVLQRSASSVLHGHPDLASFEIHAAAPDGPGSEASDGPALDRPAPGGVVRLPLVRSAEGVRDGELVVGLNPGLPYDDEYRLFLRLVAGALSRAWERLDVLALERRQARRHRALAAALQQSLLSVSSQTPGLDLAVRYRAAAVDALVGGDWYDAFSVGQDVVVSVGDVAGHDRDSAAHMAHLRGLLRGISHARKSSPSTVLSALDEAMADLALPAVATAVVATVTTGVDDRRTRTVRVANAGHPPPIHVHRDGTAHLVAQEPELLLGVMPGAVRTDALVELGPGEALLLYTDGLVERRGRPLDAGFDWLVAEVERCRGLGVETVCDHLLDEVGDVDDDIALLMIGVPADVSAEVATEVVTARPAAVPVT